MNTRAEQLAAATGQTVETKKNRQYESMTRIKHYDCTVRVWSTEDFFRMAPRYAIISAVKEVPRCFDVHEQARMIAAVIETFPDVAAYEILDEGGNGGVVYPDWK
jgi:hypothetical protein